MATDPARTGRLLGWSCLLPGIYDSALPGDQPAVPLCRLVGAEALSRGQLHVAYMTPHGSAAARRRLVEELAATDFREMLLPGEDDVVRVEFAAPEAPTLLRGQLRFLPTEGTLFVGPYAVGRVRLEGGRCAVELPS